MSKKDERITELHTIVGRLTADNQQLIAARADLLDTNTKLRNQVIELDALRQKHIDQLIAARAELLDTKTKLSKQVIAMDAFRQKHIDLQDQYAVANEVIRELREAQAKLESDFDAAMRVIDATLPDRFSRR
jgi:predicted nuclease with TOPRIM domain